MLSNTETTYQINLSYPAQGLDRISFNLRALTAVEEAHIGLINCTLPAKQRLSLQPKVDAMVLTTLMTDAPEGFSDLPDTTGESEPRKIIEKYFTDGNPLKEQIVADALAAYRKAINPDELALIFLIAAREHVIYRSELPEMHPMFDDCPRICALKEQNAHANGERYMRERQPAFCEDCTAGNRYQAFIDDLTAALEDYAADFPESKQFSLNEILGALDTIVGLAGTSDDTRINDDWTVSTARLVSIYRRELRRPQRIADWNDLQKQKANQAKSNLNG